MNDNVMTDRFGSAGHFVEFSRGNWTKHGNASRSSTRAGLYDGGVSEEEAGALEQIVREFLATPRGEHVNWRLRAERAISSLRSFDNALADHIERETLRKMP